VNITLYIGGALRLELQGTPRKLGRVVSKNGYSHEGYVGSEFSKLWKGGSNSIPVTEFF
jgi:hypothetical protein